jgi:hypothetical protein
MNGTEGTFAPSWCVRHLSVLLRKVPTNGQSKGRAQVRARDVDGGVVAVLDQELARVVARTTRADLDGDAVAH